MKTTSYYLSIFSFIICLGLTACDSDSNDELNDPISQNKLSRELIGTWQYGQKYYYLLSNGEGFNQGKTSNDGISLETFIWTVNDDILTLYYDESSSTYSYIIASLEDDVLLLNDEDDGYKREWKRINRDGTSSIDYKKPPYECYIKSWGYYYPISKVITRCYHGYGGESNFKFLQFFGINGKLVPIGAVFELSTPSWDGINGDWPDGTYRITADGNHWVYGGYFIIDSRDSQPCDGSLKIKTVNNIKILDFELNDGNGMSAVGHFVGTVKTN